MLEQRLRSRAPSAAFVSIGILRGYRLHFNKLGQDDSGKGNIERSAGLRDLVYGVIFTVDDADVPNLDEAEDMSRGGYSRSTVQVEVDGTESVVESYFANSRFIDNSLRPFDWYAAMVVAGALQHGIPAEYCAALASVPTMIDPQGERRQRALAILGRYRSDFEAGQLGRVH